MVDVSLVREPRPRGAEIGALGGGEASAADALARLEDRDGEAARVDSGRGGQAADPRADDDDVDGRSLYHVRWIRAGGGHGAGNEQHRGERAAEARTAGQAAATEGRDADSGRRERRAPTQHTCAAAVWAATGTVRNEDASGGRALLGRRKPRSTHRIRLSPVVASHDARHARRRGGRRGDVRRGARAPRRSPPAAHRRRLRVRSRVASRAWPSRPRLGRRRPPRRDASHLRRGRRRSGERAGPRDGALARAPVLQPHARRARG